MTCRSTDPHNRKSINGSSGIYPHHANAFAVHYVNKNTLALGHCQHEESIFCKCNIINQSLESHGDKSCFVLLPIIFFSYAEISLSDLIWYGLQCNSWRNCGKCSLDLGDRPSGICCKKLTFSNNNFVQGNVYNFLNSQINCFIW